MTLEGKLEEHCPPSRVTAECGECGIELFDTDKKRPTTSSETILSDIIVTFAEKHREECGHDDLQVNIDSTTPVRKIDATITVND